MILCMGRSGDLQNFNHKYAIIEITSCPRTWGNYEFQSIDEICIQHCKNFGRGFAINIQTPTHNTRQICPNCVLHCPSISICPYKHC